MLQAAKKLQQTQTSVNFSFKRVHELHDGPKSDPKSSQF